MATPSSAEQPLERLEALDHLVDGPIREQARDGQRQLAEDVAVGVHHDAAADLPEARDRERHVAVVDADAHDVVCVVCDRRRERTALQPESAHEPDADAAGGVMALDDGDLGDVSHGIGHRDAVLDGRELDARVGQELLGHDLDHAHGVAGRGNAEVGEPDRRRVHGLAHPHRHRGARERRHDVAVEDERAILVDAARAEGDEIVEQHEIGAIARCDRTGVRQAVVLGRVQRRKQQRVLGRDALGDGLAAHLVEVALAHQEVGLAIVRAERAALGSELPHQRQQRMQVAGVRGLADQHPGALATLLQGLLVGRRLVIRADSGGQVGVQRVAAHARGVAVDVRRAAQVELAQLGRIAGDHGREVHHLGDAQGVPAPQHRLEVAHRERPSRRLERARGDARRRHHPDVERHVVADVEQPVDAVGSEHVGDLVRVRDDRGRAPCEHDARELVDHQLRRLDVHVRVDESGHEEAPARVEPVAARIAAETRDAAVGDRDVDVEPLAGERGEDVGALDHQVGLVVAAGDVDQAAAADSLEHQRPPRTMSSGRTGTRTSARPVASRTALTTAGVDEIVGGSPTPFAPYGASGSPSSSTCMRHGRHVEDRRDQVVGERRVAQAAVRDQDLLHQREAEALRGPALDLALDRLRVQRRPTSCTVASSTTLTSPSSQSTSTTARWAE